MSSIFRITDPIPSDNSIDKYEDIEYEPVAGSRYIMGMLGHSPYFCPKYPRLSQKIHHCPRKF